MAKDVIVFGEVAARDVTMIEIRCGRCDRHGRLSVKRPLAEWGSGCIAARHHAGSDRPLPAPERHAALHPLRIPLYFVVLEITSWYRHQEVAVA